MTEFDLKKLKDVPVPPAREDAKARALAAASAAYAEAGSEGLPSAANPAKSAQGSPGNVRPIDAKRTNRRAWMMRRETYALAASVAVFAIGLPAVWSLRSITSPPKQEMSGIVAPMPQPATVEQRPVVRGAPSGMTETADARPVPPAAVAAAPKAAVPGMEIDLSKPDPAKPQQWNSGAGHATNATPQGRINQLNAGDDLGQSQAALPTLRSGGFMLSERKDATTRAERDARAKEERRPAASSPDAQKLSALVDKAPVGQAPVGGVRSQDQLDRAIIDQARQRQAALPSAPPAEPYSQGRRNLMPEIAERQRLAVDAYNKQKLGGLVEPQGRERGLVLDAEQSRDRFASAEPSPVKSVATEPVSTFSIDVDTASYALVRRSLNAGRMPPREAVRVEEMINYFPYAYPSPESTEVPFRPTVTVMPSPWNTGNKLVHVAIKGYDLKSADRPRANLVLLVDISGSMQPADRLPLLKNAFRMLVDTLRPEDTVSIVTYASGSDVRLKPTKVTDKFTILSAIDSLSAGGSTAGAAGITDAYRVAEQSFDKAAVNRVILATDGDWNVGITNRDELKRFIERKRESGIYLSVLGVGMGNHNDALMQALAQNGNGVAAYIDTLNEARKVLVDEASSTLFPIAKDVKIQVEFNPARIAEYRLVGYETRSLKREDFNNDKVDAGDIGSGHTVTAIYEVTPVGQPGFADTLRYGKEAARPAAAATPASDAELAFLKIRYKLPKEETSRLISLPVTAGLEKATEVPAEVRFSVAVAAFGQMLRNEPFTSGFGFDDIIALASGARGEDAFGYRAELVNLVRLAKAARR